MVTRFFDILFSGLAIVALSPLLIPIMMILLSTGEGRVFFRQKRIGRGMESFQLLKFATMLENSPNIGSGTITTKNDPRILPVGKLLRKTKINELPQLINIFLGDMSVIGPRPLTMETFSFYPSQIQSKISSVRPGLSGIGSIIFRNEEEIIQTQGNAKEFYASEIAPYKGELEKWYVSKANIIIYFVLIILTAWVVLFPKSKIVWKMFKSLPAPPSSLGNDLGYN
ncbi:MAG: sugar transferase [Alphaproteobacteria bacterium]|nr:sugar transferase [Alphaproteobacteria bacterium]